MQRRSSRSCQSLLPNLALVLCCCLFWTIFSTRAQAQEPSRNNISNAQRYLASQQLYLGRTDGVLTEEFVNLAKAVLAGWDGEDHRTEKWQSKEPSQLNWKRFFSWIYAQERLHKLDFYVQEMHTLRDMLNRNDDDTFPPKYETIVALSLPDSAAADRKLHTAMVRATAMAGIVLPLRIADNSALLAFYNPVADVALVLQWMGARNAATIGDAILVPGGILRGASDSATDMVEPSWYSGGDIVDRIQTNIRVVTEAPVLHKPAEAAESMQWIRNNLLDKHKMIVATRLIAQAKLSKSGVLPCSLELDQAAKRASDIPGRFSHVQLNIKSPSNMDDTLIPRGGGTFANKTIRIYQMPSWPKVFIIATATKSGQACRLETAKAFDGLSLTSLRAER